MVNMKIGIVIRHCLKKMSSNFLLELVPYFSGHEIHIFTGEHDTNPEGVIWHKVPFLSKKFSFQEISFTLFSTIIMFFNRFDVTMSQPTRFFSPDVAQMEFCYKGWQEHQKLMGTAKFTFKDRFVPVIEGFNMRRAKKVIVTSEGIKREIMKYYGIPEEKITVIPNGVNIERFKRNDNMRKVIRKELGISSGDFVIIFVGRNLKRKGFEYLLKALPLLNRKAKLIVAGGNDGYYQNLTKDLKQEKNVFFIGDVPNMEKYFSASDVFVFPTFYEGFSLATVEAAACGVPVIAAKANGTEDLIDNGKNGFLLKKRDKKEIAEKLNILMKDRNLLRKMGENARESSLKYSWGKIAKRMLSVLEEAAEMKRRNISF